MQPKPWTILVFSERSCLSRWKRGDLIHCYRVCLKVTFSRTAANKMRHWLNIKDDFHSILKHLTVSANSNQISSNLVGIYLWVELFPLGEASGFISIFVHEIHIDARIKNKQETQLFIRSLYILPMWRKYIRHPQMHWMSNLLLFCRFLLGFFCKNLRLNSLRVWDLKKLISPF